METTCDCLIEVKDKCGTFGKLIQLLLLCSDPISTWSGTPAKEWKHRFSQYPIKWNGTHQLNEHCPISLAWLNKNVSLYIKMYDVISVVNVLG